jgi:hypothetical protein
VNATFVYRSDQLPFYTSGTTVSEYRSSVDVSTSKHNLSGGGSLRVHNNAPSDELIFPYLPLSGLQISPFNQPEIYVNFVDQSAEIFENANLPWPIPLLSDWTYISSFISFEDGTVPGGSSRRVYFSIDEMTVTQVPALANVVLTVEKTTNLSDQWNFDREINAGQMVDIATLYRLKVALLPGATTNVVLAVETNSSHSNHWQLEREINAGPMTNTTEFYRLKIRTVTE